MKQKPARKTKAREAPDLSKDMQEDRADEAEAEMPPENPPVIESEEEQEDREEKEEETADDFLGEMIPIVGAWMRRLMNDSKKPPANDMMTRSREAAASSTIVKTLQDLDALARAREKRGKKNSTLDERQLMEKFIRRLDELLSRGMPPSAFKPSAPRKPDGG